MPDDTRAPRARTGLAVALLLLAGCWPGRLTRLDGGAPDGGAQDGGLVFAGDLAGGLPFQSLAPCFNTTDYMSGATVSFGNQLGNNYSPRCLVVRVGQSVSFAGDFSSHPLRASTRGSAGNPVQSTGGGTSASFTFAVAGFFPYYCTQHGDDLGNGMAGVVQVTSP